MPKFTELPGASPPGPPPGLCPAPAGELTAPSRPPAVFLVPMAAPLPKCFRRAYLCRHHDVLMTIYDSFEQNKKETSENNFVAQFILIKRSIHTFVNSSKKFMRCALNRSVHFMPSSNSCYVSFSAIFSLNDFKC